MDKLLMLIMKHICSFKELKNIIILESHNDFDSNTGAFYDYLIKNHYNRKYKIIWRTKNRPPKELPENVYCFDLTNPSIKKAYYMCAAKYWFYGDVSREKVNQRQINFYLTHGGVTLKNVKGRLCFPEDTDYYLCASEYCAPIWAEILKLPYPNDKQVILGYPSHDVFYSDEAGDLKKITDYKYDKVILWMPTFRKTKSHLRNDSSGELPLGVPIFHDMDAIAELNEILKSHDSLLIIKIHPKQELESTKVESLSNIMVLNGITVKELGVDNYRLMKEADALISDYSSAAYDYLHMRRPIGYTMDDLEEYKLGLVVDDPTDWIAGPSIYNKKDFMSFIYSVLHDEDEYKLQRDELFDKIFKYHDGNSSKRIVDFLGL